jgi:hypothetical protein
VYLFDHLADLGFRTNEKTAPRNAQNRSAILCLANLLGAIATQPGIGGEWAGAEAIVLL